MPMSLKLYKPAEVTFHRGVTVKKLYMLICLLLGGCAGMPDNVDPVKGFDLNRYMGTWYEIARLDHSFERGMSNVTAQYSVAENNTVRVVNRGYLQEKKQWKIAEGKAKFGADPATGYLQVSFFGPFYGAYVIIDLDLENYQYALVCGPSREYLWILSREPELKAEIRDMLISRAEHLGFAVAKLILVSHQEL